MAIAALNESPDVAASRPFVRVLGEMFGPRREDSAIGMSRVPLDELFAEPARRFIEARGGEVLLKTPARLVTAGGATAAVSVGDRRVDADAVVSAVPWHALGRLWDPAPPAPLGPIVAAAGGMRSSPIVSVTLWFDGPLLPEPFVGLIGGPMHWAFDKARIAANDRHPTSHIAMVASGADDLVGLDNATIADRAVAQLRQALPEAGARTLRRSVVVREHRATFSVAPGSPPRPPTVTPFAGFYLAGDWTDTGLPATIEGAVVSGHRAAEALLRRG